MNRRGFFARLLGLGTAAAVAPALEKELAKREKTDVVRMMWESQEVGHELFWIPLKNLPNEATFVEFLTYMPKKILVTT